MEVAFALCNGLWVTGAIVMYFKLDKKVTINFPEGYGIKAISGNLGFLMFVLGLFLMFSGQCVG